jgi:hypothetical protein
LISVRELQAINIIKAISPYTITSLSLQISPIRRASTTDLLIIVSTPILKKIRATKRPSLKVTYSTYSIRNRSLRGSEDLDALA